MEGVLLDTLKLLKSCSVLLRRGGRAYLSGLMQITHGSSAVPQPLADIKPYGWNHVLFEHGSDGNWRKDNITIVADGGSSTSYKVFIEWNKGKEGKEGREAKEGRGDYIVCYVPNLWALYELIKFFYPTKIPKFTSLEDASMYTH